MNILLVLIVIGQYTADVQKFRCWQVDGHTLGDAWVWEKQDQNTMLLNDRHGQFKWNIEKSSSPDILHLYKIEVSGRSNNIISIRSWIINIKKKSFKSLDASYDHNNHRETDIVVLSGEGPCRFYDD